MKYLIGIIYFNKTMVTKGLRLKAKTSHRHSSGIYLEGAHWGNTLALSPPTLFFTPGKRRDSSHWLFGEKNQGLWLSPFLFCLCLGSRSNYLKSMLSLPLCALSVRWPSLGLKMGKQVLGWLKSSFRCFHNVLREKKSEQTSWLTQ